MSFDNQIPENFYQQFKAWVRLEPRCRSNDFSRGLQARSADPLWYLARQWQTGEFKGQNAGSPIKVQLRHSVQEIENVRLGDDSNNMDLLKTPPEALVERERMDWDYRFRAQVGQHFERLIRSHISTNTDKIIGNFRNAYPFEKPPEQDWKDIDRKSRRFIEFMAGKVIDGKKLYEEFKSDTIVTPPRRRSFENFNPRSFQRNRKLYKLGISKNDYNHLKRKLFEWYNKLLYQPDFPVSKAWQNQQLHYRFKLNSNGDSDNPKTQLSAPGYRNGAFDWYSVNRSSPVRGEWQNLQEEGEYLTTHPTQITLAGMSPRWWAFEDGAIDFGKLDVAKPDLAKLLLMEFVLIYGDDWFSIPLSVPMGNLARIDEIKVLNVFGEDLNVLPARKVAQDKLEDLNCENDGVDSANDPLLRWELFSLTPQGFDTSQKPDTDLDILFIPPVTGFREESSPIEEVRFLKDEGANMVWGIEHLVPNSVGTPVDGFDLQREQSERNLEYKIRKLEERISVLKRRIRSDFLRGFNRSRVVVEIAHLSRELERLKNGSAQYDKTSTPLYRLATTVPENWIPFVPTNWSPYIQHLTHFDNFRNVIRLRRAQMLRNSDDEEPTPVTGMSRLLDFEGDPIIWLEEATVPRSGLRVQLTAQRARWIDGKTYVWLGRKVLTGRGEGNSGLEFDVVDNLIN